MDDNGYYNQQLAAQRAQVQTGGLGSSGNFLPGVIGQLLTPQGTAPKPAKCPACKVTMGERHDEFCTEMGTNKQLLLLEDLT